MTREGLYFTLLRQSASYWRHSLKFTPMSLLECYEFSAVMSSCCVVTWQLFEAMNQLRQQMDQQKSEFDEERERLHAKMSVLSFFILISFIN